VEEMQFGVKVVEYIIAFVARIMEVVCVVKKIIL
jgi:hypothetical protein